MSVNFSPLIVRFGTFELDLQTGELRHAGKKVRLQEQPFQVLAALLEHPGKIVTREELRSKLWPEDTFVDFDHSLNAAIKRLRDALGESADAPVFIETLARRGYRFIAPVNDSAPSGGVQIAPLPERSKSLLSTYRLSVGCIALLMIASLIWAVWRLPLRRTDIIERKLTANLSENSVSSAAVSHDGIYLAYADNTGVYLKLIRTGETHRVPLPADFTARVDDWFPDGSHLLVTRQEQVERASLWSVSVFGGSPRPLADDAFGGSVSPDGAHIAFRRVYGDSVNFDFGREQWVMRSDGAEQIKVATDKSDGSALGAPTWSPDCKRIAYIRTTWWTLPLTSSVEVNDWQTANAQTLFSDGRLTPALHWLRDGRLIYALSDSQYDRQDSSLWTVPLQQFEKISGPPNRITGGSGWISHVAGSADGRVVAILRGRWSSFVSIGTLAADGTHLLANRRLTLDENANYPFSWTPDSKAVLFASDRNGSLEIFKQPIDQPLAESLASSEEQLLQPRLTPDGSEILYVSTPKSTNPEIPEGEVRVRATVRNQLAASSILAIPKGGGTPRLVLKDVGIWNVQCARLPSTICLYSITKGNTTETFRFDVRSGTRTGPPQIDAPYFVNWSLSPDGSQRAIIVLSPKQEKIQLRPTSTGETRDLVVKGWNGLRNIDWSADGKSLLVGWHNYEWDSALLKVTLDGRASVLLHTPGPEVFYAIPSPDGRLLAIGEATATNNVWQIENFR
jgi:DNA-binding winged helix-turn-helix (wHTH) protein/Tol biopolymer transport system component